jgi:DNA-binding GntR family transcriptional regulator
MQQSVAAHDESEISSAISFQQRVYENLRNSLISGVFAPGDTLSLRRIAAANCVSPMPVREAFKRLISEHAIELLPNRTIVVPKLRREAVSVMSPKFVLKIAWPYFCALSSQK